jgi:hypothetical protein
VLNFCGRAKELKGICIYEDTLWQLKIYAASDVKNIFGIHAFFSSVGKFSHFVKRHLSSCRFCCCNNYTFRVMERGHAIKIIKRKRGAKRTLTFLTPSLFLSSKTSQRRLLKKTRSSLCSVAQIHHATHHRVEFVFRTLFNKNFLGKAPSVRKAAA